MIKSVSVFLDLRKAFYVIRHDVLLTKLQSHGVKESELRWFNSYLSERSQCVVFKDAISAPLRLSFGVPQGSVLGPTLFNIHSNNISKACHISTVSLYADNTKMHSNVIEDLRSVQHWFRRNGLICNTKKMETMVIASKNALGTTRDIFYGS